MQVENKKAGGAEKKVPMQAVGGEKKELKNANKMKRSLYSDNSREVSVNETCNSDGNMKETETGTNSVASIEGQQSSKGPRIL